MDNLNMYFILIMVIFIALIALAAWVFHIEDKKETKSKKKVEPYVDDSLDTEEALRMSEWLEFNAAQQGDWAARDSANYIKKYLIEEVENSKS